MLQGETRSNFFNASDGRELFQDELLECRDVGDGDTNQIIDVSCHQVTLHHLFMFCNALFKLGQCRLRLLLQTDGDENKTKARYLKYRVDELKAEELKNESLAAEVTPTVKLQDEVVSSESRTNIALPLEVDAEKGIVRKI